MRHSLLQKLDSLFKVLNVEKPGDWPYQLGFVEGILIAASQESEEANRAISAVIDRHIYHFASLGDE